MGLSLSTPFPQGLVQVVHVQNDGDASGKAAVKGQRQKGPVVDVDKVRLNPGDDLSRGAVIDREKIPVTAVEPLAPAPQRHPEIFRPVPCFPEGQLGIGHPDDNGPPAGEAAGHLVDKQLRRPTPDGRDGIEFGSDEGDGGHERRPLRGDGSSGGGCRRRIPPRAREMHPSTICTLYHQTELIFSTFRRRAAGIRQGYRGTESNLFINFLTLETDFVICFTWLCSRLWPERPLELPNI